MSLDDAIKYGIENIKDIIALGFNPKLTYIFSNYNSSSLFEYNTLRISKAINLNEALRIFGFNLTSNIGMIQFPAKEIAPAFPTSFPFLDQGRIRPHSLRQ
ncbi:tryptophanyl-tRNA synthetase [Enterocytozoon bieneusi H348]|nr:tryptophanyl-tRNA synthetase [Enterocytozoon bieneusi H348]|eukprot:XP_002650576.1 tryptophanyl-tRNA synthetase [Enterocytozoon bieneusi H348]